MRAEHPDKYSDLDSFLFQRVERVSRLEDRIAAGEPSPKNYYKSTERNFSHAFSRLKLTGLERVLEVGAEHDFPFLRAFRERGCECYATNLFFSYEEKRDPGAQVVLGDMNHLPYRNEVFDVVLLSATSHHSPDLPGLLVELARVTKADGHVLLLNDPTRGLFKHTLDRFGWSTKKGGDRHDSINENEYSIAEYRRYARAAGLDVQESFFSVYYDEKLQRQELSGIRFSFIAKLISRVWHIRPARRLLMKLALYPGQVLIGLELNMILRKRSKSSPGAT